MFTVHGTTMMVLFAVPAIKAIGVILLPQMLAARNVPFPRLSAFAVWAYVIERIKHRKSLSVLVVRATLGATAGTHLFCPCLHVWLATGAEK